MSVIPFNVPGLREPDELSSEFVFKWVKGAAPDLHTEGVLCIYPGLESAVTLINANLQTGRQAPVPAVVVSSESTDGLSTIFGLAYADGLPQLIIVIMAEADRPAPVIADGEPVPIDVSGIEERIELSQVFHTNYLGVVSRVGNKLVSPSNPETARRMGERVFALYDDVTTVADVCSFYFTRELVLTDDDHGGHKLLWRPTPAAHFIAPLAAVYVLTRTSLRARRSRGRTD